MVRTEEIYGISYEIPPQPKIIEGQKLKKESQKFRRVEIPKDFRDVEFDELGNPNYSEAQEAFIAREFDRITNGYWFMNFGTPTYLNGLNYFYLNYWVLEDGNDPTYRDCDRRWFYFQEYCESQPRCYGIIRIKKRREGATSQATCYLVYKAITTAKANCGIVSKTGKPDAKDAFIKMVVRGFRSLPIFFKPRTEDDNPKSELILAAPKSKKKIKEKHKGDIFDDDRGLESVIDFRSTSLNSYDSGRMTAILIDEGGKFPADVPVNQYWGIVKKTLQRGATRVGFALMPSTVNDSKNGGAEFKLLWDDSNHIVDDLTGTGMYRYFCPAYDGYEGFIDEYGYSQIEEAKKYLEENRARIQDPVALAEAIRMEPFTEDEAFYMDAKRCYFNVNNIYDQINYLAENKVPLRRVKFLWKTPTTVDWIDAKDGDWLVYEFPKNPNGKLELNGVISPAATATYCMGIDPFRSSVITGKGSMGVGYVLKRLDPSDPNNSGMPVAQYEGRPRLKSLFHDEMLKAAVFYSCQATYENDVGDDFVDYFRDKGMVKFLSKTPDAAIDSQKRRNSHRSMFGVASRDPFALSRQLEVCINFIELHCNKIYYPELLSELLEYDHDNRTSYDKTVAFMIGLLGAISISSIKEENFKPVTVPVRTYKLKF